MMLSETVPTNRFFMDTLLNSSLKLDLSNTGGSLGFVSTFDGSPMSIVSEKLTLTNYRDWAQAVQFVVGGRSKLNHLTEDPPTSSDPIPMNQWKTNDLLVCSWLVNAISPQLKRSFMYLPTAKAIWEAVRDSYSYGKDHSREYGVRHRIWKSTQGARSVTEFWLELVALWQELDLMTKET